MNGTTPAPRLGLNDEFRIVQGDRHGRVVSSLYRGRLWIVWWDDDSNYGSEIVTFRTCRLETEDETRELYLRKTAEPKFPVPTCKTLSPKSAAGRDAANQAALNREDVEYEPQDRRTFGSRLEDGFDALEGQQSS